MSMGTSFDHTLFQTTEKKRHGTKCLYNFPVEDSVELHGDGMTSMTLSPLFFLLLSGDLRINNAASILTRWHPLPRTGAAY